MRKREEGRGCGGGGRGCNGGGMRRGSKVAVEPRKHGGVFIAKGEEDALVTKEMGPCETVYNEKKIYARILALNAFIFSERVISIKANCIDSTVPAEAIFQSEMKKDGAGAVEA
ncbi:unnamed protein product [Dovyalis caffra]|uniref:Uncharacterized protein n=1 Tax=Dovyalis caffra TaxID=77055 RepID=A0AAV1RVV0_9ROSI|nr:unnamed protein product [Dovyalis caffra]